MDDNSTQPGVPESQTEAVRGGSYFWLAWAFALLLAVYPLSIGPAAWLATKVPASQPAIEVLYRPIQLAASHCHPVAVALVWYMTKVWRFFDDVHAS